MCIPYTTTVDQSLLTSFSLLQRSIALVHSVLRINVVGRPTLPCVTATMQHQTTTNPNDRTKRSGVIVFVVFVLLQNDDGNTKNERQDRFSRTTNEQRDERVL